MTPCDHPKQLSIRPFSLGSAKFIIKIIGRFLWYTPLSEQQLIYTSTTTISIIVFGMPISEDWQVLMTMSFKANNSWIMKGSLLPNEAFNATEIYLYLSQWGFIS